MLRGLVIGAFSCCAACSFAIWVSQHHQAAAGKSPELTSWCWVQRFHAQCTICFPQALSDKHAALEAECSQLQQQLEASAQDLQSSQQELQTCRQELQQVLAGQADAAAAQEQLAAAQQQLAAAHEEAEALRQQLAGSESAAQAKDERIKELRAALGEVMDSKDVSGYNNAQQELLVWLDLTLLLQWCVAGLAC